MTPRPASPDPDSAETGRARDELLNTTSAPAVTPAVDEAARAEPSNSALARVHVPQPDGEISLSLRGDEPFTFTVVDHIVDVPVALAARLVAAVDGSKLIDDGTPAADQTEE